MNALETRQQIQTLLGVSADGQIGPRSRAALESLISTPDEAPWPIVAQGEAEEHEVMASSFADSADVGAFRRCKANGGSDEHCFAFGDNGVGKWGDDCTAGSGPICALPPEDWQHLTTPRGAKVLVSIGPRSVVCELRDTMPHKANITNGAGIDLNPDAVEALGQRAPMMVKASWRWARRLE